MTEQKHEVDLTGAALDGADLRGADLRGVIGLTLQQISRAIIDDSTCLPEHLVGALDAK